jgi:flagellar basal-body rod protein FlgC
MGMFDILKIGASALKAQRTRMEVIATNLSNIHSTKSEEGGPYKKKDAVFMSADITDERSFGSVLAKRIEGVKVSDIEESNKPFEKVFDPNHPDADAEGYVTFPNVNLMEEMTDMVAATRAYEANVNVLNTTKEMFIKSLEIGK